MSRSFYRVYAAAWQKDAVALTRSSRRDFSKLRAGVDVFLLSVLHDVVDSLAATMFCPNCKAEYREGFTRCADCDVELVHELPSAAIIPIEPINPGDPVEDPFCSFWKGDDPRLHVELCELLSEQSIPYKTIRRQDHLFNWNTKSAFEIGVPFSQFDRAEAAVKDAYGGENEPASEVIAVPLELPESVEPNEPRPACDHDHWYPEEATVRIWEGDQLEMAELLAGSLRENQIPSRVADTEGIHSLFVLPADELRAREIVREVVEGVPPG